MLKTLLSNLKPGTVFCIDRKSGELLLLLADTKHRVVRLNDFTIVDIPIITKVISIGEIETVLDVDVVFRKRELTIKELLEECDRIIALDESWEEKWDLIFSLDVYHKIHASINLYPNYDPSKHTKLKTTEQLKTDVMEFVNAFRAAVAFQDG